MKHELESSVLYNQIRIDEDPEVVEKKIFKKFDQILIEFFLKGAEIEDLEHCAQLLVKSMIIREKYMMLSLQSFPYTTAKYLNKVFTEDRRNSTKPVDLKQSDFFDQRSEGESEHFLLH